MGIGRPTGRVFLLVSIYLFAYIFTCYSSRLMSLIVCMHVYFDLNEVLMTLPTSGNDEDLVLVDGKLLSTSLFCLTFS